MPAFRFSPFAIPPAITAALLVVFAVRVMLTRSARTSMAMAGMAAAAAGWQIAFVFMYLAVEARTASIWARIGCAFVPLVAAAAYQFVTGILEPANHRRIVSRIGWLVATQFAILTFATDYVVTGAKRMWWGFYPDFNFAGAVLFFVFCAGLLVAAIVDIVRAYPAAQGLERKRLRLFGIALGIGLCAVVNFPAVLGFAIYPMGWIAVLGCMAVSFYTITKLGMVAITPSLAANEIISTMRDLLFVSDREGRIRFANNAACAFLGYGREDIIGRRLEDLLVPSVDADATLRSRSARDREYVFRTKMGQPIELTLSHSPVTHEGEVTGAVIIGRDLRDRKRYEWEARRAVALLQSTLDSTADGILVIDQEGRVLTWNQRFADLWGVPAELLERDEDRDLIEQLVEQLADPGEFLRSLEALRAHPEVESMHLLEFKDGRRLEQYSIGRYLDNSPVRVWSFRDVTARMSAEEALRDSEARYRLLFEQNAAGVCLATIAGRILDCNSTFADMVGLSVDEVKNRQLRDVFERVSTAEEIRRQLDETPTLRGLEIDLRRPNGERVAALANVSLLGRGDRALVHLTAVDISDRKRAEEQIEFYAYHDALTQLPNRRLFQERLELSLLSAKRARGNVGVLFIDLDRFKAINDTLGHSVADALLVEVAERLRSCVRQTDTVARYGGDEFTISLPDLHLPEDAARVAEKILERVVEPVVIGTTNIELSVSIGIAVFPYDGTDFDSLLRNADDAMYRAKKAGRNTYQLCTEQMKTRATERLSMQSRLRRAMNENQLALAYQPQVSIATGLVVGMEALIRWNDPERGVIEWNDFIAIAEDTGLIVPLGEFALFAACRQVRQWRNAGLPPVRMAVNISTRQFQQRDLATVIRRAVDDCGIDATMLELEISETTATRDAAVATELLNLLRDTGVSLTIDHFGAGHSSLGYLQMLPINAVKIDAGVVDRVATTAADAAIAAAVIDVSRTLNLRVGAEGVGSREQVEFLKARGCHEAQGSYFSTAVDAGACASLMASATPLGPQPRHAGR